MRALIESMEKEAKKEGYIRLTMVSGSEDLFQVSSQTQYDLLILDMNLQERVSIEGWEILKKVLQEIETRKIRDLVQVSRTTIVNVRYIQQVIQENGNYKLVMVQYGQGQAEQIPVGRSFLKSLSWLLP